MQRPFVLDIKLLVSIISMGISGNLILRTHWNTLYFLMCHVTKLSFQKCPDSFDFRCFVEYLEKYLVNSSETSGL